MNGRAEVARLRARLDSTFERARVLSKSADIETQADFARYLCVLVSGYLEKSVTELVMEHSRRHGDATLQRFVEGQTRRFANANCERLKQFLGGFSPDWRARLDILLIDELKDAVNSLVDLRNSIAHGGSAGITYSRVVDYYSRVNRVLDEIANLCAPLVGSLG